MDLTIPATMKAALMTAPLQISVVELPVPEVEPDEVLVKVMAVGVCGSDIHYYEHGRIGPYVVKKPIILGHECAGIVVACGEKANRFSPGDRVAIEPGVTCGRCDACKQGRYNLCPDVQFLATPPVDGAFVQYIAHREDFLFPIPDHLSFEEAALNEPFSVGIHALRRAGFQPGQTVAIIGMGPVGLMAVAAAKSFGASRILVSDVEVNRLKAATLLGATDILLAGDDASAEIIRLTNGVGVDVALETAGHPRALKTALSSLRRGGKLSIVGLPPVDEVGMQVPFICDNEIDIYGIFRYANTYPQGIQFLSSGLVDIQTMITDRYPLEQAQEAMERARTNKAGSLKVMVYPNPIA
ncbi:alcohol dehydrogenase catalytic domain-containing protein [Paenibacillus sp. LMG 31456]|uniref:Alcohol dehydrogenase catalytic domain-containing protein n=2 Tax=Paenibacillus foliorum TaxID=2654974 RepID=A0A972H242_9BACL|nr:alcohol dehydrogenase catalytic domain-containing protein [Paenibacillus foliorum]NOU98042.1 alcohol dehydrogenase catalytic domain-containing protein [Paenibacillus foliorum]